jgi:hypothetical protein
VDGQWKFSSYRVWLQADGHLLWMRCSWTNWAKVDLCIAFSFQYQDNPESHLGQNTDQETDFKHSMHNLPGVF